MRIRDLKRTYRDSVTHAWPPSVLAGVGGTYVQSGEGVLKRVKREGNRLSVTIEREGQEVLGSVEWDQPPSLDSVETVLRASIGQPIKAIGDREV